MRLAHLSRSAALGLYLSAPALLLMPPPPLHAAEPQTASGVQTRSGLRFIDFKQGSGSTPRFGQLIRFHYVAYVQSNGKQPLAVLLWTYSTSELQCSR